MDTAGVVAHEAPLGFPALESPPFIGAHRLAQLISPNDAIELVANAMRLLSTREGNAPERWLQPVGRDVKVGLMPGAFEAIERFGVKVLAFSQAAESNGHPSHQGLMLIFDARTAQPICILDGNALTALRTAAASAVATRALSRSDSRVLAIIGCGHLARPHIEALRLVRPISEVRLWNRTHERAQTLAGEIEGIHAFAVPSVETAVAGADIVCTLTSSLQPVLAGARLEAGQHINLVGSSTMTPREVDEAVVTRARYFVDSRKHALSQASEFRRALAAGMISEDHMLGEIGEVLEGTLRGRISASDITAYKSLGHIVQDLSVGDAALRRLQEEPASFRGAPH